MFVSITTPNNAVIITGWIIFILLIPRRMSIVSTVNYTCDVTALFGVFIETNKHKLLSVRVSGHLGTLLYSLSLQVYTFLKTFQ